MATANNWAQLRLKYGITQQQYQALLQAQEGKCAACGKGETRMSSYGRVRQLSVDHCHATGKIRGLLCDSCNNILGRAEDSPAVLRRLASYLEVANTKLGHSYINADKALTELCTEGEL